MLKQHGQHHSMWGQGLPRSSLGRTRCYEACLTLLCEISFILLSDYLPGPRVLGSAAKKNNAKEAFNGKPTTPTRGFA